MGDNTKFLEKLMKEKIIQGSTATTSEIINHLKRSIGIRYPFSSETTNYNYINMMQNYTKAHCVKLGITDPEICDNITKKCIQNEDNYKNFKKEKFDIKTNNIENQELCEKAWGKSIKQQVNEIIKSSKLRHLLLNTKNITNANASYLNTADWMNHIVPDKLKDNVSTKLDHDYSPINLSTAMRNLLKYRQDIPIENMLLTMDDSKDYITNEFNINKTLLKDHNITQLISTAHIDQKRKQLTTEDARIKLDQNLKFLRKYDDQTYPDIIEWLVYWQSYQIPLFSTILLEATNDDFKIELNKLIKKYNEFVIQESQYIHRHEKIDTSKLEDTINQIYIDLLSSGTVSSGSVSSSLQPSRKKLIQILFNLTDLQYQYNIEILNEYNKIITKKNTKKEQMIDLNDFIVYRKYKDKFADIARTTGTENKSKYPLITVEKVEDLIYRINEYNTSETIKSELKRGILKLLESALDFEITDYKNDLISDVIIKKEYFKTIATINPNDVALLKLAYDIHHLKLIEDQSKQLEIKFPFGLFPLVTPMQKVLFLISNETDMDKAYAFYQAIKDDEVQTSVGDLNNIIQYYLEYLHSQGIKVDNEQEIKAKIKDIKTFNKELVQIARSLQILAAIDSGRNATINVSKDSLEIRDTTHPKIKETDNLIHQEYINSLDLNKKTLTDVISHLDTIKKQLYSYSEIMDFLKLIQKHYYRIK